MITQPTCGWTARRISVCLIVGCLCVGLLGLAGCRRKRDQVPDSGSQAPATAPGASAASPAPTASPTDGKSAPTNQPLPPVASIPANHFSTLSQALLTFRRDKQRAPKDWQELITTGYLKALPPAPPGKRYTFHPQSLDVLMVNQ